MDNGCACDNANGFVMTNNVDGACTYQKSWLRIENSTDVVLTGNSASTFLLKDDSYIANSGNITTGPLKGPGEEVLKNWLESHRELWDSFHDDLISAYRSEEHTSELQSLMRIPYAVFCLKNKNNQQNTN